MNADFHWKADTYVEQSRSIVPRFDELQAAAIAAIPFAPETALDLGIGTGETSRRLLDAFPDAKVTGLDSSPEMVFRARELGVEVKLARIEDPLPDGPWDLVIAALSIHHLSSDGKKDLFRRVREHARALVIADLVVAVQAEHDGGRRGDYGAWWSQVQAWRSTYPLGYETPDDGTLAPQYVIERLGRIAGPEALYVAGVGQHQMWAAQFISYENPNTWLNSGGLGTMGYAVPAAMGAKVGRPDATVWAIDGDGCFQMTNQELATCAIEGIPIKVAIINNSSLGMVRQWQTLFYEGRYSNTDLDTGGADIGARRIPDFVKLAEAYGCAGLRCEQAADVDATIEKAMGIEDRPVVVDFVVHQDAMVWPMVPAGTSNDEIQVARDMAPQWDTEAGEVRS